jgi:hypothetical protein
MMLEKLGYSGPIVIEFALGPFLRIPWLYGGGPFPQKSSGSELDEDIIFSIQSSVEDLRLKTNAVALEVVGAVLYSANLADPLQGLGPADRLKMGYAYNTWGTPPPLNT